MVIIIVTVRVIRNELQKEKRGRGGKGRLLEVLLMVHPRLASIPRTVLGGRRGRSLCLGSGGHLITSAARV